MFLQQGAVEELKSNVMCCFMLTVSYLIAEFNESTKIRKIKDSGG